MMTASRKPADRIPPWLETQYCASVAATLLARNEYFELLEDAMMPPERLVRALSNWKQHANQTHVLGGLVGTA
ncbi:MAG: hypothetical protein JWL65_6499 [Gammaproteobacteria bacterium]|jgi:hypothetical protein|nr:hypothetical protein [Gammaproteobacteria bacterium]